MLPLPLVVPAGKPSAAVLVVVVVVVLPPLNIEAGERRDKNSTGRMENKNAIRKPSPHNDVDNPLRHKGDVAVDGFTVAKLGFTVALGNVLIEAGF